METYYLIDFENVHNEGIANIKSMTKTDHMHIFSTQNATNINKDVFWINGDIKFGIFVRYSWERLLLCDY